MVEFIIQVLTNIIIPLLVKTAIIWVPVVCFTIGKKIWLDILEKEALLKMDWIMLEIKVPRNVHKIPQAMEIIFSGLEQGTPDDDWFKKWWKGEFVSAFSSLEIVSIEGNVYFFIRTQKKNKDTLEALIYSQYPGAEVSVVDDYTRYVPEWKPDNGWTLDVAEFHLTKDDPIPIKTYLDYGLDAKSLSLEEEQKIDPITPLIEALGSLKRNEQLWMQIVVRQATKRYKNTKGEDLEWVKQGREFVDNLIKEHSNTVIGEGEKAKKVGGYKNLSPADQETVDAVERSIRKPGFDVGIRVLYIAKKEDDKKRMGAIKTAFKQFNSQHLNSFKAVGVGYKYPWQDLDNMRKNEDLKKMFKQYIHRSFFYEGLMAKKKIFTLNTEELATIFHFPGRVSTTGSFERIQAQKAEPPANLPI
jgi:hypothetical protein